MEGRCTMKDWNERSAEERAAIEQAILKAVREADNVREFPSLLERKAA